MFSNRINCILVFFDFCGFYSEYRTTTTYRKISFIIFVFHLILCLLFTIYSIQLTIWLNRFSSKLNMVNEMSLFFIVLFNCWVVIIESFHRRKTQRKLWQICHRIDKYYARHDQVKLQSFVCKFLEYFIVYPILMIYLLRDVMLNAGVHISAILSYSLLLQTCRIRVFFYLFYLELIIYELGLITNELKRKLDIYKVNKFLSRTCTVNCKLNQFERSRFKWLREYYLSIQELSNCVNSIFGWSSFLTILFSFNTLFTDINTMYSFGYRKSIFYLVGKLVLICVDFKTPNSLIYFFSFFHLDFTCGT